MDFQDVAFLPTKASFSATFHNNCGRGESLGSTTCLKTVVLGKQTYFMNVYMCIIWSELCCVIFLA